MFAINDQIQANAKAISLDTTMRHHLVAVYHSFSVAAVEI